MCVCVCVSASVLGMCACVCVIECVIACVIACLCQVCVHAHMCWRHVEIGCFLACFDLSALFDLKLFWVFAVERLMSFWTMRWHLVPGVAVLWTFSVITWLSVRLFVILVFCLTARHRWTLQYASTCCMPVHPDAPASSFNQPDNSLLSSELDMKAGQLAHFWHTWQTCTLCGRHCTPLQVVGRRLVASRPPVELSESGPRPRVDFHFSLRAKFPSTARTKWRRKKKPKWFWQDTLQNPTWDPENLHRFWGWGFGNQFEWLSKAGQRANGRRVWHWHHWHHWHHCCSLFTHKLHDVACPLKLHLRRVTPTRFARLWLLKNPIKPVLNHEIIKRWSWDRHDRHEIQWDHESPGDSLELSPTYSDTF